MTEGWLQRQGVGSVRMTVRSCRDPSAPQAAHTDRAKEKAACFGRDDRGEKRKAKPQRPADGRQAKAYPVVCSSARPFEAQDELKPGPDEDESKFLS